MKPMANYSPEIGEEWTERADDLSQNTVLSQRQADVQALSEQGCTRQEIADELEISINTVDEHRQDIKKRIRLAEKTVDELGD